MVYDEGLRSYKAIAFIRRSRNCVIPKEKNQLISGATLSGIVLAKQKNLKGYPGILGENYG